MSRDRKSKRESCDDDIIPIEGSGIDLSALSNSGLFTGNAFEAKQGGSPNGKGPQDSACGITLETIALDYVSQLPQRIKVLRGVYGDDDETSLSTDDIYDIHFVRRLKTITVCSMLGQEYQISCNSSIRAATIYGTNNTPANAQDRQSGALFSRVANVVAAKPMPKMLCTCKSYAGSSPATSVEENEIIAVFSVTLFKGYKYLHVYSFNKRCEKRLPLICNGEFSTHPARTHVPLLELLEHVSDLRMLRVMFFPEKNGPDTLPQVFFKEKFTIMDFGNTTALVGVPYTAQAHYDNLVEFSSCLKAEIVLLPMNRDDHRVTTAALMEEYDKRRAHFFRVGNDDSMPPVSETVAELLECAEDDEVELMFWLQSKCDVLEEITFRMKEEVNALSVQVADMAERFRRSGESGVCPQLQTLTQEEVQEFLSAAGLSQYRRHFANEMIDGMVLAEMDEEMWKIDLGIHVQSDWMKLKGALVERWTH